MGGPWDRGPWDEANRPSRTDPRQPLGRLDKQIDWNAIQAAYEQYQRTWNRTYRFAEPWPADIKQQVDRLYRDDVEPLPGGMGCMQAAYQCLETIHPGQPKYEDDGRGSLREKVFDVSSKEKKFNSVDLMMEVLQREGRAGEPVSLTFDAKAGTWSPPAEAELLKMFEGTKQGVYFFGVSVHSGNHTVLLAVDNTPQADGKPHPRIFWLDQNTRGLTKDVTGGLGAELASHGTSPTKIWPLRPEQISRDAP